MERFGAWQAESEKQTPDLVGTVKSVPWKRRFENILKRAC